MRGRSVAGDGDSERMGRGQRPRASRGGEAVVIVDVDQVADIRSSHGARVAEQVTRAVAQTLRSRLRGEDRLALLREDEFLAVLPGAPAESVPAIAARLRDDVQGLRLALSGTEWSLRCTIGAAARDSRPCALEALVRAADIDLHRARRGR